MRCHRGHAAADEAGFTLIEMIVALALLALISIAGLALVDAVLAARTRTEGRLDRLADIERASTLLAADLSQLAGGSFDAGPTGIGFDRTSGRGTIGRAHVSWFFAGNRLERIVDGRSQPLLDDVQAVRWSFLDGPIWRTSWPPEPRRVHEWPRAVAAEIVLQPRPNRPTGTLRRVVALPAQPIQP